MAYRGPTSVWGQGSNLRLTVLQFLHMWGIVVSTAITMGWPILLGATAGTFLAYFLSVKFQSFVYRLSQHRLLSGVCGSLAFLILFVFLSLIGAGIGMGLAQGGEQDDYWLPFAILGGGSVIALVELVLLILGLLRLGFKAKNLRGIQVKL